MIKLNQQWQKNITGYFNKHLLARFPFDLASKHDLSWQEAQAYFSLASPTSRFIHNILYPLAFHSNYIPSIFSQQTIRFIKNYHLVQRLIYPHQALAQFKPIDLAKNIAGITINQNQAISYQHGPQFAFDLNIPSHQAIRVHWQTFSGKSTWLYYPAPWALLHLLYNNRLIRTSSGESILIQHPNTIIIFSLQAKPLLVFLKANFFRPPLHLT